MEALNSLLRHVKPAKPDHGLQTVDSAQSGPATTPPSQGSVHCPPPAGTKQGARGPEPGAGKLQADVWQRGDKWARGALPDGAAANITRRDAAHVPPPPVQPPPAAGDDPEKKKKPVTLDAIILEYRKTLRLTTHRHIWIGGLIDEWIHRQPERKDQLPRAAAIIVIEERMEAEGLAKCCKPHRDLKCYHTARIMGGDADGLAISAIYRFVKLIERDAAADRWRLVPKHVDAANRLWGRMLAEHLTSDQVRDEVLAILAPTAPRRAAPHSRLLATALRLAPHMTLDELAEAIRAFRTAREKLKAADSAEAAA